MCVCVCVCVCVNECMCKSVYLSGERVSLITSERELELLVASTNVLIFSLLLLES